MEIIGKSKILSENPERLFKRHLNYRKFINSGVLQYLHFLEKSRGIEKIVEMTVVNYVEIARKSRKL